ncbi:hypothetical protein EXX73_24540, partial [Escherichia coli]
MRIYGRIWLLKNCIFLRKCCLRWTVFRENNEYTKGKDAFPFCLCTENPQLGWGFRKAFSFEPVIKTP